MKKKKSAKRETIEWLIFFGVIGFLYFTGLHTPVLGFAQGLLLKTGIIRPSVNLESERIADYNWILEDEEGQIVNFSEFKEKTVFLNFWATWCPPCVAEMPDIDDLYTNVVSDNTYPEIAFVLVSFDKDFEKAKAYLEKKGFDVPIYTLKSNVPEVFQTRSIPTTYVISPEGKIMVEKQGMAKYNTKSFRQFLKESGQTANFQSELNN